MIEKNYFSSSIEINFYVATIGINKDDWTCHKPGMKRSEIRNVMVKEGYDVVPIITKDGRFKEFFTLDNEGKLKTNNIDSEQRMYYLTHFRDAIWRMKSEQKTHYFLSNGRNENDIVGLLSLSNFNCREFYVFIFSLISYIEREFARFIKSEEEEGLEILKRYSHSHELQEQLLAINKRINDDRNSNIENDYKEYLYLHHIIWLLDFEKKYVDLGYKNSEAFIAGTRELKEIRNTIAHPVKSLVRSLSDLDKLDNGLNKLYQYMQCLDNHFNKNN